MYHSLFGIHKTDILLPFLHQKQNLHRNICKLSNLSYYAPNHRKNRNPREIPCLLCVTNVIELTRCTRSKATKRIWIFSSVLSELLLLYFLLTACLLCVSFITTRILLLKNTQDLSLGLQESNPRQPGYKPCLLPLN